MRPQHSGEELESALCLLTNANLHELQLSHDKKKSDLTFNKVKLHKFDIIMFGHRFKSAEQHCETVSHRPWKLVLNVNVCLCRFMTTRPDDCTFACYHIFDNTELTVDVMLTLVWHMRCIFWSDGSVHKIVSWTFDSKSFNQSYFIESLYQEVVS